MKETSQNQTRPEWIALPPAGERCTLSGLKRGKLLQLAKDRKIKSVHLREPGTKRGSRLLHVESLLSFLEAHVVEEAEA